MAPSSSGDSSICAADPTSCRGAFFFFSSDRNSRVVAEEEMDREKGRETSGAVFVQQEKARAVVTRASAWSPTRRIIALSLWVSCGLRPVDVIMIDLTLFSLSICSQEQSADAVLTKGPKKIFWIFFQNAPNPIFVQLASSS